MAVRSGAEWVLRGVGAADGLLEGAYHAVLAVKASRGKTALASTCGGPPVAWTAALRRDGRVMQAIRLRHSERRHDIHPDIHHGPPASAERR